MRLAAVILAGCAACGVPKDFVKQETLTAFNDTASVMAHVNARCGSDAGDEDCRQSRDKLAAICHGLDELARRAGGGGFDCAAWKAVIP